MTFGISTPRAKIDNSAERPEKDKASIGVFPTIE